MAITTLAIPAPPSTQGAAIAPAAADSPFDSKPSYFLPPSAPSPRPTSLLPFNPDEAQTRKVIRQLADPTLSLADIADEHDTDFESIIAWMARPDIVKRLDDFNNACAARTRMAANSAMSMVVTTCKSIIHEFHDDQHHMGYKPQDPHGHEVKRRNRETALRAGRMLIRLAGFRIARAKSPSPSGPNPAPNPNRNLRPASAQPAAPDPLAVINSSEFATQLAAALAARTQDSSVPSAGGPPPLAPAKPAAKNPDPATIVRDLPAPTSAIPHPKSDIPASAHPRAPPPI